MAFGIVWFSLASLLLPVVVLPAVSLFTSDQCTLLQRRHGVFRAQPRLAARISLPCCTSNATQAAKARWVLPAVIAARAMVGLGEGVALPAMNNLVSRQSQQHPRVSSLCMSARQGTQEQPAVDLQGNECLCRWRRGSPRQGRLWRWAPRSRASTLVRAPTNQHCTTHFTVCNTAPLCLRVCLLFCDSSGASALYFHP